MAEEKKMQAGEHLLQCEIRSMRICKEMIPMIFALQYAEEAWNNCGDQGNEASEDALANAMQQIRNAINLCINLDRG